MNSADISIFLLEIRKFCYIKKYKYRLYFDTLFLIPSTFFESLKILLIKMVTVFMMSAKMATLGFLEGYDIIISVYDVINKKLSRDSNYIVNVVITSSL